MPIKAFLAGFFLFNAVPHLVKGITGETHMTPFKKVSSPVLNVIWGFVNLMVGFFVLGMNPSSGALNVPAGNDFLVFLAGGFVLSIVAAKLFADPKARFPWHQD